MKVLITCGPTWVPIDDVRVISNTSSGEMGHLIAEGFLNAGCSVTLIQGPVTHAWSHAKVNVVRYNFFDELEQALKVNLRKKYDCVIHAAAVSDFKVKDAKKGKIDSGRTRSLSLAPTRKLIDLIKQIAPGSFLVGFKLEPKFKKSEVFQDVRPLFTQSGCDLVVANTLMPYQGFIVDADGNIIAHALSKRNLAKALVKTLL